MSLLYSNRFIKSIEPHVKLVALRLPWWPEPGCCCCGIMIDYKTEYARHYLSSTILFSSFQKLIFESRQKIKLIASWQRHFIAGSLAKLAASLISLWARTFFAESYKNTLSAVPTRRLEYSTSCHLQRVHHICHAYNRKRNDTIHIILQCTMVTICTTYSHSVLCAYSRQLPRLPQTTLTRWSVLQRCSVFSVR